MFRPISAPDFNDAVPGFVDIRDVRRDDVAREIRHLVAETVGGVRTSPIGNRLDRYRARYRIVEAEILSN